MSDAAGTSGRTEVGLFALQPGLSIGRYRIDAVLGQGGFGITYRAYDQQLHRDVAIKEYLPSSLAVRQNGVTVLPRSTEVADDFAWGRERFVAEGRTLASLNDAPGIVRVFDFLEDNGTAYIVMELVPGETLEAKLKRQKTLSPAEVEALLPPLLDGLIQVHDAGFLHRDIKPANILLRLDGRPVLIDFGASRAAMAGRSTAMTAIFTPGFAAAEQMTSARQGPWTDIYGLSATLYMTITGEPPPAAFDRMLDDTYRPLVELAPPGFSRALLAAIDAGLEVRSNDRPQSIPEWRAMISAVVDPNATIVMRPRSSTASTSAASTSTTSAPPPSAPSKRRTLAILGSIVAVALLSGGIGYSLMSDKPRPTGVALQDLKVEDLEKALDARRKADAEAAEMRRREDEAKQKAMADADARRKADTELDKARQETMQAEQQLERLKAQIEEQKKLAADGQRQAQIEEEKRKAETLMAEKRRLEEEAKAKVATDTEAQRKADEELARAQAGRAKAEADARAMAMDEDKKKAEADANTRTEAEAKAKEKEKAEAEDKQKAEMAETALKLGMTDRQRLQVALTSQGFDTRGNDGAFGPRTREMVMAWQKARSLPPTGFLNASQQQQLMREAAAPLQKYDEEQKLIGSYGGTLTTTRGNAAPTPGSASMMLQVATTATGMGARGELVMPSCGTVPFTLNFSGGQVSGTVAIADQGQGCTATQFSVSGKVNGETVELNFNGPGVRMAGTLRKGVVPPPPVQAAASPPATPPATAPSAPPSSDGSFGGSLAVIRTNSPLSSPAPIVLRIAGPTAKGEAISRICGTLPFTLAITDGQVSGSAILPDYAQGCSMATFSASGKINGDVIDITFNGPAVRMFGTLRRGVVPSAPTDVPQTPPPQGAPSMDGTYGAQIAFSGTVPATINARVAGNIVTGEVATAGCGNFPFGLSLAPTGQLSGTIDTRMGSGACIQRTYTTTGRIVDGTMQLDMRAPQGRGSVTMRKGIVAAAGPAATTAGSFDGAYGGTVSLFKQSNPGGGAVSIADTILNVAGSRATGQLTLRQCGKFALNLLVSPSGEISGQLPFVDGGSSCDQAAYSVEGKIDGQKLTLTLRSPISRGNGTLNK